MTTPRQLSPIPGRPGWWTAGIGACYYLPLDPAGDWTHGYRGRVALLSGGLAWSAAAAAPGCPLPWHRRPNLACDHCLPGGGPAWIDEPLFADCGRHRTLEEAMDAVERRIEAESQPRQLPLFGGGGGRP